MFREVLHSRRGDLLSIIRGLDLQIAKDNQSKQNSSRLEEARAIIEEELQLRVISKTYANSSLE